MNDALLINQFLIIAAAHFIAVVSPGPDLAVVIKQSIQYGKRNALLTSVGIGSAILIHVIYSALGVGLIIKQSPFLFDTLKYLCAAYLTYIGYKSLTVRTTKPEQFDCSFDKNNQSLFSAFNLGFITNVLNPKATLFFLSIFSVIVSDKTPNSWFVIYAVYLSLATMVWFSFISLVLSKEYIRIKFMSIGHYFDWLMGIVLIGLAIKVVFSSVL